MITADRGHVARSFAVVALMSALSPAAATTGGPVPEPRRTALILFVSYRGSLPVFPDPTRVRLTGAEMVQAALNELGGEVVTYPEIELLMQSWRVRSERDLGFGFLDALSSEHGVDHLVVATMYVTRDRIFLLVRASSLVTRELQRVDVIEERTEPGRWLDPDQALADLEETVIRAAGRLAGQAPTQEADAQVEPATLVILPLRPIGTGRGYADLATHCILESVLDTGRWSVPDPALTFFAMQRAGFDPLLLEEGSRHALASRFGVDTLVIPRLISFPLEVRTPAAREEEEARELGVSFASGVGIPFQFSVVAVDCASGVIVSEAETYLAPDESHGIFGREQDTPIARRFRRGAAELVESLLTEAGE